MQRSDLFLAIRLGVYLVLQVVLLLGYVHFVELSQLDDLGDIELTDLLREDRWLEWAQISVLMIVVVLSVGSLRSGRPALHRLLLFAAIMALFRELDSFLGDFLDESHRIGILVGGLAALYEGWRSRAELLEQIGAFVRRPGLYLLVWGFMLLGVYSQLLGQREIWDFFAREDVRNLSKRFIEEGLEFMGYVVIACGVFEERFFGLRTSPTPPAV